MSRSQSPQNVRVAARSRLRAAPPDRELSLEVWLPSSLQARNDDSGGVQMVERTDAVPADPAAAAELGAETQRLRRELDASEKRAETNLERAERAEEELVRLGERIEAMKRAAAKAAAVAHPGAEPGADA